MKQHAQQLRHRAIGRDKQVKRTAREGRLLKLKNALDRVGMVGLQRTDGIRRSTLGRLVQLPLRDRAPLGNLLSSLGLSE